MIPSAVPGDHHTTTADQARETLRAEILTALSVAGAFCGECGFEPGEEGCTDCQRVRAMYADAVMPTVDRLRASVVEMTRCRDNAIRALRRDDVQTDIDLAEKIGEPLYGPGWDWEDGTVRRAIISAAAEAVRPAFAKLTEQRDQARAELATARADNARLVAAADAASHSLSHFIYDSTDPGSAAFGAQWLLQQALVSHAEVEPTPFPVTAEQLRAAGMREGAERLEQLVRDGEHDPDALIDELNAMADATAANRPQSQEN